MKFNRRVGRKEVNGPGLLYDRKYFGERKDEESQAPASRSSARRPTSST